MKGRRRKIIKVFNNNLALGQFLKLVCSFFLLLAANIRERKKILEFDDIKRKKSQSSELIRKWLVVFDLI